MEISKDKKTIHLDVPLGENVYTFCTNCTSLCAFLGDDFRSTFPNAACSQDSVCHTQFRGVKAVPVTLNNLNIFEEWGTKYFDNEESAKQAGENLVKQHIKELEAAGIPSECERAKGYKLFRLDVKHPGKLFPLFVNSKEEVPMNKWIDAKEGERTDDGKVKSKIGPLCFRPGWHLSDIPLAIHIGVKGESGKVEMMNPDYVWCKVWYLKGIDYQKEADANGTSGNTFSEKQAYLTHVPKYGFYRYKTSPNMLGKWIIAGRILVNEILSDEKVNEILSSNGYEPMPRQGGPINLLKYGF